MMKRLTDRALPPYKFVPGENPHPKKDQGHMEGEGDPVSDPISLSHPERSENLRYALDLLNQGYFWESHVYFESLWNAHGRKGSVADLLKAFIKIGAAGVKYSIGQRAAAEGHLARATELYADVKKQEGQSFLGFDLDKLSNQISGHHSGEIQPIYPDWE